MHHRIPQIISVLFASLTLSHGELNTYQFPETTRKSPFYEVTVKQGETEKSAFVHVSECPDGPFTEHKIWITVQDRSMSFTHFTFDESPVEVSVTKLWGTKANNVIITPSSYGVPVTRFDGHSVSFKLERPEYISVRFISDDNTDEFNNILNGLMLFADPPETEIPDPSDTDVYAYQTKVDTKKLIEAPLIYFPPGVHHLKQSLPNGLLLLRDDQQVYLHPEAYVYGMILGASTHNVRIFGRGILSGFDHEFHYDGMRQNVELDELNYRINLRRGANHTVEGVTLLESINHTLVVPRKSVVKDVKFISWACNNDGLRCGDGSWIEHVFMKVCDDYFYATSDAVITRSVLWPMFNGATLQLGWGNHMGGGTRFVNNHIINPEWEWIGSNTGFIASQCKPDANIGDILIENLVVDGDINALAALDFAVLQNREYSYGGSIHDIHFKNITVNGRQIWYPERGWDDYERIEVQHSRDYSINAQHPAQQGRSILKGIKGPNGNTAWVESITFENVKINGEWVTQDNVDKYFDIDRETTQNLRFILNTQTMLDEPAFHGPSKDSGFQNPSTQTRTPEEASWLGKGDRLQWRISLPESGEYEIRYSLMPHYTQASAELWVDGETIETLQLPIRKNNVYQVIKQRLSKTTSLSSGTHLFELSGISGHFYPDLLEIVPKGMAPGTDKHTAYTHWHGIIRRSPSNWISSDLYLQVTPTSLQIRLRGDRWDEELDNRDKNHPLSVNIFNASGASVWDGKLPTDGKVPIRELPAGPYMTVLSDHKTFWIAKHFNRYATR